MTSPSGRETSGLTRVLPDFAPVVVRSTTGAPWKFPPTLPWLARNSSMIPALKSFISAMLGKLAVVPLEHALRRLTHQSGELGWAHHTGGRAELEQQPFEPGQTGHVHDEVGHRAVAVPVDLTHRDRLGHPSGTRTEFEVDLVGTGTGDEHVLGRAGPAPLFGDRLVELAGFHDAVDPEAPHVARPVAVG